LQGQRAESARSIDIRRLLSARTRAVIQAAGAYALGRGQAEVDQLHLLHALPADEPVQAALEGVGLEAREIAAATEASLPEASESVDGTTAQLTASAQRSLFHAVQVARSSGATYVDPEHLFFALVLAQDTPAGRILARHGASPEALLNGAREHAVDGSE